MYPGRSQHHLRVLPCCRLRPWDSLHGLQVLDGTNCSGTLILGPIAFFWRVSVGGCKIWDREKPIIDPLLTCHSPPLHLTPRDLTCVTYCNTIFKAKSHSRVYKQTVGVKCLSKCIASAWHVIVFLWLHLNA